MHSTIDPVVLRGARRAFAEHGYARATLEEVAREAGVSRVTLHRRGITKPLLLGRLVADATERYRACMWPALTATGSGGERLESALTVLCEVAEEFLDVLVTLGSLTDNVFHDEAGAASAVSTRSVFTEPLERLIRDGVGDGSLPPTDPSDGATLLFNAVGWTYVHLRSGHRWPPERAADAVVQLALRGVRGT